MCVHTVCLTLLLYREYACHCVITVHGITSFSVCVVYCLGSWNWSSDLWDICVCDCVCVCACVRVCMCVCMCACVVLIQ